MDSNNPIITAVTDDSPQLEIIKQLVEPGVFDINQPHDQGFGKTALHYCASRGLTDIVKFLIDNKADVNIKDDDGHTPIYYAHMNKFPEVVQLLKSAGAEDQPYVSDDEDEVFDKEEETAQPTVTKPVEPTVKPTVTETEEQRRKRQMSTVKESKLPKFFSKYKMITANLNK